MVIFIYGVIVMFAAVAGTVSGLGGGVIIKPLFDMAGFHSMGEIGFYSSVSVFTMSLVSMIKQIKGGFEFNYKKILYISCGSIIGGLIGEKIFEEVASLFSNRQVKVIQSSIFALILLSVLIYTFNKHKMKQYKLKNFFAVFLTGLILGAVSVFLGIGGGPLNIAVLMLLFSCDMKESAVYSIVMIFFSQLSKLGSLLVEGKVTAYELSLVPAICTISIVGGFIGTILNQRLDSRKIEKIYVTILIGLFLIALYNVFV